MGMFKKRKSRSDGSESVSSVPIPSSINSSAAGYPAYDQHNLSPRSSASAPQIGYAQHQQHHKKKKGLGSKLKGLVRRSSDSKSVGGGSSSVVSRDESSSSHTNHNNEDHLGSEPPRMNRKIAPPMLSHDDYSSSSSSEEDDHFQQELGTVTEVNEDDYDSDGELKPRITIKNPPPSSSAATSSSSYIPPRVINPSRSQRLGGGTPDQFVETITLVILLVDPNTKRFELLQLQQNPGSPKKQKNLKVKSVLQKFKKSITDPELKKLKFVGLVDRFGVCHKPNARLATAMKFDNKKDILVGLVQGVHDTDKLIQSVRPILGDPKMGKLLDMNGFDTKGWVKKKKTKDSILDKPSLVQVEKQGGALSILAFTLILVAILVGVDSLLVHLDQNKVFVQPLIEWPEVMESAGDFAKQGVQAAKEVIMEGNSTTVVARVANSTFAAAVEDTYLETAAMVKDLVVPITTSSPKIIFENAKDMVMMSNVVNAVNTTKVAKAVSEATTNVSANIANVSSGIAHVVTSTIVNATKNVANNNNNNNNTGPNSVWEDYILIGLLVCW
eukprot:CAMPEP_0113610620 /NCGR_PEP_ID=MMETSP0017_2-20120614/5123_1 /TAXON_ID=2856 /ORGANISM="Cylindrotheca closterium" /LENGTH=555 /DNA_ID=CAMNT_0000519519 /DNA_START=221 /DNA_END=1885 /DNA_ORIENTATION=+ /assembly_acc=CAM_ASM_000147